ncbi:hypothetical protein V8F20_006646 [Naviculisporaceae sp. PSN 640]
MASDLTHYPIHLSAHFGMGEADHHLIFVATDYKKQRGPRLRSVGSLQVGMVVKIEEGVYPLKRASCLWMQHKGWIRHKNLDLVKNICLGVPPPAKQYQGNRCLVPKGELRHCQHWVPRR